MSKPNFFIVGAPKCGTTAMNDYLIQHPKIFMAKKELHYFGLDLNLTSRLSDEAYLSQFSGSQNTTIVGEASVWYLFSETAATEIKAFSPDAKILIMLRNPIQVLHSLHSQHLFDGNETITDFQKAIELDDLRKAGYQLPRSIDYTQLPPYLSSVQFTNQVKRYFSVFGRKQVKIILYDDFVANTEQVLSDTFSFLGIEPDVPVKLSVINRNKQIRFFALHRLIKMPPLVAKNIVRLLLPFKPLRHAMMHALLSANVIYKKRRGMQPNFEQNLKQKLAPEVESLSTLLNRNLAHWLK